MQEHAVAKPLIGVEEKAIARPLPRAEAAVASQPMAAGVIYGEIVYWFILAAIAVALAGLVIYLRFGGYLDSRALLNQLWQGSDSLSIWQEVGSVSQPVPWYSCFGMLSQGDMLAVLGLVVAGVAAVIGMWGAFIGTLRSRSGIYAVFSLIIAVALTLSAAGILKLQM